MNVNHTYCSDKFASVGIKKILCYHTSSPDLSLGSTITTGWEVGFQFLFLLGLNRARAGEDLTLLIGHARSCVDRSWKTMRSSLLLFYFTAATNSGDASLYQTAGSILATV